MKIPQIRLNHPHRFAKLNQMNNKKKEKNKDFAPAARSALLPFSLILIFALQALWHAKEKSATYDEVGHLTASYLLWKSERSDYDIGHPPLIRDLFAIPLVTMDPPLPALPLPIVSPASSITEQPIGELIIYGTQFLYGNRIPADSLLFWTRSVNIFLGCLLGFCIFKWSEQLYGKIGGLFSLALFAFCPNLIAHASLVTTDLGGTVFAVIFLYALTQLIEKKETKRMLFAGMLLGLALLSKFSNIYLPPLFIIFYALLGFKKERNFFNGIKTMAAVLGIGWLVLCSGYKFENVFMVHTLQEKDWALLHYGKSVQTLYRFLPFPDTFLRGIASVIWHDQRGHGAYLLGNFFSSGWWYYFPVAFLAKSPTITLLLLFFWIFLLATKKINLSSAEMIPVFATILFLGSSMTSKINIGLRHILLSYPLLYVLLGRIGTWILLSHSPLPGSEKKIKKSGKVLAGLIFFFLAGEIFSVSPHYLAFFNRLAGGPEKGIELLSDSNIDWGQELKNLAKFLKKEGDPEILLSYFGTAVPQYYGIQYQSLPTVWSFPKSEHLNSPEPKKEFLAVSVTNLQGTYFSKHDLYGWLKNKKPIAKIGYSIYVYDITDDLESQTKLLEIYQMTGELNKFLRQVGRVKKLSLKNAQ